MKVGIIMKRNFLLIDTYSAMDWHDWDRTLEYIENGTFEDFIKKELERLQKNKQIKEFDIDKAILAIKGLNKKPYEIPYKADPEEEYYDSLIIEESSITYSSQFETNIELNTRTFDDNDLCWMPVEEFHTIPRVAPLVQRFYSEPFATKMEAEKFGEKIKAMGHGGDDILIMPMSRKEYESKSKDNKGNWYNFNIKATRLMKKHPECEFIPVIQPHVEKLEAAEKNKSHHKDFEEDVSYDL